MSVNKIRAPMMRTILGATLLFLVASSTAWADKATESAQQKLKEGGFYYGEINGSKDTETTAAIRRYQIRNGLKITGELDAETLHSLGVNSKPASRPAPTPGPPPPDYPQANTAPSPTPLPRQQVPNPNEEEDTDEEAPPPQVPAIPQNAAPFGGTPYEGAPPHVQQDIVTRVQVILMRQGFYRDDIDGRYGPALSFALRNYQARLGLEPSGRMDVETLALLRLLPEQQAARPRRFHPRLFAPRPRYWRPDERIYIPR
jgi:peptidoglycan hydrolase-like protein with peptidoglycan-binding domain